MSSMENESDVIVASEEISPPAEPLELLEVAAAESGSEAGNYYDRSRIRLAQAGQPIAKVLVREKIRLGPNVEFSPDGQQILAKEPGQVNWHSGRIWVESVLEIRGDVDFTTGCIEFAHDVSVRGSVLDLFKITSGGTVRVGHAVEAAHIQAAVDLLVNGPIVGKGKGHCIIGQNVHAKHISNVTIEAGKDVIAKTEITHSHISCGGKLAVERGSLMASQVVANGGVHCGILGCAAGLPMVIEVGVDPALRRLVSEQLVKIEADQKKIEKIKQTVEPLMRNAKGLSAAQKEQATELLFRASEVEDQNRKTIGLLRQRSEDAASQSHAEVHVEQLLCAGVILRMGGLEAAIVAPLRGPIKIGVGQHRGERRILATSQGRSGACQPLPSHPAVDHVMDKLQRLLV